MRVFLADDHAIVRKGLRGMLLAEAGIEIVGVEAMLYPSFWNVLKGEDRPIGGPTLAEGIAVKNAGRITLPATTLTGLILLFGAYALAIAWQGPRRMIRLPVVDHRFRRR